MASLYGGPGKLLDANIITALFALELPLKTLGNNTSDYKTSNSLCYPKKPKRGY